MYEVRFGRILRIKNVIFTQMYDSSWYTTGTRRDSEDNNMGLYLQPYRSDSDRGKTGGWVLKTVERSEVVCKFCLSFTLTLI